jgi:Ca2+-transporting ATPase
VFEAEEGDEGLMRRPPRDPREPLFNTQMLGISLLLGASLLVTVCLASWWAIRSGLRENEVRALGFAAIVVGNLTMIHATRSRHRTIRESLRRSNPALWWITTGTLAVLAVAIYAPPVAELFRFAPLSAGHPAVAAIAGISGVLWYEGYKVLRPRALQPSAGRRHR